MQSSKRDDAYHLKTEAHDIFCSSHGAIFQLKFYADANDVQIGATLVQDRKPLGFYTRKEMRHKQIIR